MSTASRSRAASSPLHPAAFRCEVHPAADAVIIAPNGELDLTTTVLLEQELLAQSRAGHEHLVIDLRGVSFIDSCGLALLARWRHADRYEARLSVIAGPPTVQRVLELTALTDLLDFVSADELAA